MVVLNPSASALEAARAIESNNIGAVVIQEKKRVLGIVTDRDLTVRVVGQGRDPDRTTLAEVMSSPVFTLSPTDGQADAMRLMQTRNIRRIPLVEGGLVAGIVTLDDLFLDEAAPLEELSAIVQAQIGQGGPSAHPTSPGELRSAARAQATYERLLAQVSEASGLESSDQADAALEVVLSSLVRRLIPGEALDLIAQLPSLLQPALKALPLGPDKLITRESIETELVGRLDVEQGRAGEILEAIGELIAESVSRGQMEDVQGQLPETLRSVFTSP